MRPEAATAPLSEVLAKNIASWREVRELTQLALAERMAGRGFGWTQVTVTEVEGSRRRRRVSIEELLGLSDVLGLSTLILIADNGGGAVAITDTWSLTPNALSSLVHYGSDRHTLEEIERAYAENLERMEDQERRTRDDKARLEEALKEVRDELARLDGDTTRRGRRSR
jgi:transcriptional regulator with XRE-family HTH domain